MRDLVLFMVESNVANYAGDTTLYAYEKKHLMCKGSWNLNF